MPEDVSVTFPGDGPGERLRIAAFRFHGNGDGPHVHLQAGIHADEIPGMILLDQLLPLLTEAEWQGRFRGTVTVVPQANPLGLRQHRQERLLGRFHEATSRNFNRHFPSSIAHPHATSFAAWQSSLFALSESADILLDLHTDEEALPYLYVHRDFWPQAEALAAAFGAEIAILWHGDGGGAFEEVAADRLRDRPGRGLRLASTVELRGQADTDPAVTAVDLAGLHAYLCHVGAIDAAAELPPWRGMAMPACHIETLFAPAAGLIVFPQPLGAAVAAGDEVARLLPIPGEAWISLRAPQSGRLVTRCRDRIVAGGGVIAKLTGATPSLTYGGGPLDDAPG
jgi:predicted deacylase